MIYQLKDTAELITLEGDKCVIFDSVSGDTHILDSIGNDILALCDGKSTAESIAGKLAVDYNAPSDVIFKDVISFLEKLVQKGVVSAAD